MAQARDWHGRFASGGGGGALVASSGRTGLGGAVVRLPSGAQGRLYAGRTRGTFVGKINADGSISAPGKVVGAHLRAHRYPGTKAAVGSPIGGNRNLRYVSRTNAATAATGGLAPGLRAYGRGTSYRGASGINAGRMPRSGYIVARGPRVG